MSADKAKDEKKKVALNVDTYEKLKTFTRSKGLKLRVVIDVMTDLLLNDEALSAQIIEATQQKQTEKS